MQKALPYAELTGRTHFSFLEGASSPEEVVERASEAGVVALAVADTNGLYGVVRAHLGAKELNLPFIVGAALQVEGMDEPVTLLAQDRRGYGRLCRLVTRMRSQRALDLGADLPSEGVAPSSPRPAVEVDDVRFEEDPELFPGGKVAEALAPSVVLDQACNQGLIALVRPTPSTTVEEVGRFVEAFGDRVYLAVSRRFESEDGLRIARARELAAATGAEIVATSDPLYHHPDRKRLQDVMTCIRLKTTLHKAGRRIRPNAERYMRSPLAMTRLFRDLPDSVERTVEVASRCTFSLDEIHYRYALELVPDGDTPIEFLRRLVNKGALRRYRSARGGRVPDDVRKQLEHELKLIEELEFPGYFLTVWDIVRFARSRGILCQGRGSAANSAVCYVLGITAIDPVRMNLLFERFLSHSRGEPPDIDVDFEHERREEVLQYIYRKYGRSHAGMVATLICYRGRSAVREVGKVFGLSKEQLDRLSSNFGYRRHLPSSQEEADAILADAGIDVRSPLVRRVIALSKELEGTPRHLSVHVGGFVITQDPLVDLVPQEDATMPGRTVVSWDKDDVDAMGMLKVDCLGLGMLTCIRKTFDLLVMHKGMELSLATIPPEDPDVYEQIGRADTIGLFQIESRAQMNMLPRLQPRTFYDLVVEVAIVRPGPIQGDMVHPYLRRRRGEEPVDYPHPGLKEALGRTYGVPLFQEQAMKMSMVAAGFSADEADTLRRAMGGWRKRKGMAAILEKLRQGLISNGVDEDYVDRVLRQIAGFGEYGFPESHAASFALLAYASAWLRYHHPECFSCALLNSQPMGFYQPHTIVDDAKRHAVPVRPVDINKSDWDCTVEPVARARPGARPPGEGRSDGLWALRLGFRMVAGLREIDGRAIEETRRSRGSYRSVGEVAQRAHVPRDTLARLAAADSFREFGLSRRQALWKVQGLYDAATPLFAGHEPPPARTGASGPSPGMTALAPQTSFPEMTDRERVRADYAATGLSVDLHPTVLVQESLEKMKVVRARDLQFLQAKRSVRIGGLITSRQHPDTKTGMIFLAVEDATGMVNVSIPRRVYEKHRQILHHAVFVWVDGVLERDGRAINVMARRVGEPVRTPINVRSRDFH